MNTFPLVALLLTFSLSLLAQEDIQLKLNNNHPRVGDEVTVSLSKNFSFSNSKDGFRESINIPNIVFEEAREYTVGPFEFNFDGKKYTTNALTVKVEPALPIEEGIWVRWYEEEGEITVIVDHLFPMHRQLTADFDGITSSYASRQTAAKIKETPQTGVYFFRHTSHSRSLSKNKETHQEEVYSYHTFQYRVKLDSKYIKAFKLLPKHFENFPQGLPYTPIVIPCIKKS